jgi:hypothetical protein
VQTYAGEGHTPRSLSIFFAVRVLLFLSLLHGTHRQCHKSTKFYCNGDRLKKNPRCSATRSRCTDGAAALTCTMYFDEIHRDEKGFNTGDGAIVVGGFFSRPCTRVHRF